ncbi:hypothetical protein Hanom_Chr06g00577541 [Helianthus anomalus]
MFSCITSSATWWSIWAWTKLPTRVSVGSVVELLEWVHNLKGSNKWKRAILVIAFATMWIIWKSRNEFIFDQKKSRVDGMVDRIKEESFQWIKNRSPFVSLNWERWRDFNVRDIIV